LLLESPTEGSVTFAVKESGSGAKLYSKAVAQLLQDTSIPSGTYADESLYGSDSVAIVWNPTNENYFRYGLFGFEISESLTEVILRFYTVSMPRRRLHASTALRTSTEN
jgi:hypothetical protein